MNGRAGPHEREGLEHGLAASEAVEAQGRDVEGGGAAIGDQLGHELAGDRPMHEAVAAEPGDRVGTPR
jgi:hypothetical protein